MTDDPLRRPGVFRPPGAALAQRTDALYDPDREDARLAVYRPPGLGPEERRPGVVFVHGGPIPETLTPRPNDWGQYFSLGAAATAFGLVGVTVEHRLHGLDRLPRAGEDLRAALAAVRARAAEWNLDPARIAVWAVSGGGRLLAPLLASPPPGVRALVGLYPALGRPEGEGVPPDVADRFWPTAALAAGAAPCPPLLLLRAGLDRPALLADLEAFVRAALARGVPLTLIDHPGGRHGFDVLDDDPETRDVMEAAFAFVARRLAADG